MYRIDMAYTIKTLLEMGKSQRAIARELGISRKTVRKMAETIRKEGVKEPAIEKNKKLDEYREVIKTKLEKGLTGKLIWQHLLKEYNVNISYPTVSRYVREFVRSETYVPLHSLPGEEAQVDYGYFGKFIKDGKAVKVWVFSMVLSYSRYAYYEVVTDQSVRSFITSHIHAFEFFGGVPRTVKIDNLKAGVIAPDFYGAVIQAQYAEFLYHYGSAPITARVRRPQDKGKVEAGVKYVKNNFLKAINHNDFYGLKDDLTDWNQKICNLRVHGTTKKIPSEMFIQIEQSNLISLPELRYEIYQIFERKANQYGHITFEHNYYSVPYEYAGEKLTVKSSENILKVFKDQKQIALHSIDPGKGNFITREEHKPPYKQYKNKEYYLEKASSIGPQAYLFCQRVIEIKPYEYQRIINGILSLAHKHGNLVINAACQRALQYNVTSYISVKNICEKELYNLPVENLSVNDADGYKQDLSIYDNLSFN